MWWLKARGRKANRYKSTVSVTDLQMGEVSLRAVHLDKVVLGSGHYWSPMKTAVNEKHHRELVNSQQPVV